MLIDLNNQFSDTSYLVSDKTPPSTLPEVCSQIERLDDAFLEACLTRVHDGFDILAGASDPIKAGEIRKEQLEYIISVASPRYDFILFDIGQSVNPLSIAALDRSDRICVLVQPASPMPELAGACWTSSTHCTTATRRFASWSIATGGGTNCRAPRLRTSSA
ncbi:AAA family ATPase [Cupriavidus basilensis]